MIFFFGVRGEFECSLMKTEKNETRENNGSILVGHNKTIWSLLGRFVKIVCCVVCMGDGETEREGDTRNARYLTFF